MEMVKFSKNQLMLIVSRKSLLGFLNAYISLLLGYIQFEIQVYPILYKFYGFLVEADVASLLLLFMELALGFGVQSLEFGIYIKVYNCGFIWRYGFHKSIEFMYKERVPNLVISSSERSVRVFASLGCVTVTLP